MAVRRFHHRPTWPRVAVAAVLAAAVLALLWQGLLVAAAALFPEPVGAGFGTIEVGQWVDAVFLRREMLVAAPRAGRFLPEHPEGERIARFGTIGVIKRPGRPPYRCRAPRSGLVSYTYDGLERVLTPDRALADPEGVFLAGAKAHPRTARPGRVRLGQPLARLVEDEKQYLVARLRGEEWGKVTSGAAVWARTGDDLLPASLVRAVPGEDLLWAVLCTNRFPAVWLGRRSLRLYLVLGRYSGTLVPRRFLRRRNGQVGVIAMVRGRPEFVAVSILGQDRHQAAVSGLSDGALLLPR